MRMSVAARGAGGDLVQQFVQLRRARRALRARVRSQWRSTLAWRAREQLRSAAMAGGSPTMRAGPPPPRSASSSCACAAWRAERAKVSRNCGKAFSSAGSSSWRMRLRVKAVSALVGSSMTGNALLRQPVADRRAADAQQRPLELHAVALEPRAASPPGPAGRRRGSGPAAWFRPGRRHAAPAARTCTPSVVRGLGQRRHSAPCARRLPGFRRARGGHRPAARAAERPARRRPARQCRAKSSAAACRP